MEIKLPSDDIKIHDPDDIHVIIRKIFYDKKEKVDLNKEHFWVFALNQGNKILNIELVSMGGRKATTVDAAEVFRIPLLKSATRIILVHNHPGGTVTPSDADIDLTNRLQKVGDLLEVHVDDHIIVTKRAFFSFAANGIMKDLAWSTKYALSFVYEKKIRKEMADLKKKIDLERGRGVQEGLKEGTKRGKKEGIQKGREEGLKEGKMAMAKQMLRNNIDSSIIQEVTGLSAQWLGRLRREIED